MLGSDATAVVSDIAAPDMQRFSHEGPLYTCEDDEELQGALKAVSQVEMILACSCKKLANLENLLHVLAGENSIEAINFEDDSIPVEFIEKAVTLDLQNVVLSFELRALHNLLSNPKDMIVNTLHKISSSEHSTELHTRFGGKLHDYEDSLKHSQDRILDMMIQLAKLQMTSFDFKHDEYKHKLDTGIKHELHLARTERNHEFLTAEQRQLHRMLELSLANQVELEKKLTQFKQSEEDLKVKIRLIEQVGICMEEAAEVAWGQFLEADNAAAVLMEISKETMGRFQTLQIELISSTKREGELKSAVHNYVAQLNEKQVSIQKLNSSIVQLVADNATVESLREEVRMLEQKLGETESKLMDANASCEASQEKLKLMEGEIMSLRESNYALENRAENAEEKVAHLTDSNMELTEELDFLKGSNESSTKKVSVLEKQLREFDIQLQHARASSEAGQEQQNMLYTAIWDMETLIDELKQKVASTEVKLETSEEQRLLLSETNKELNKEVDFLRAKMEFMGASLDETTLQKQASAEDISVRTQVIMDMVVQLAIERERIQKQLASVVKENMFLREKSRNEKRYASTSTQNNMSGNDKEFVSSEPILANSKCANNVAVKATDEILEVEGSTADASMDETETRSSTSENDNTNAILSPKAESSVETGTPRRTRTFMLALVVLLSILVAHLLHRKFAAFRPVKS